MVIIRITTHAQATEIAIRASEVSHIEVVAIAAAVAQPAEATITVLTAAAAATIPP